MFRLLALISLFALYFAPSFAQEDCIAPRLESGGLGQVLPGAANRLRDTPSTAGNLIGEIPGGSIFAVLDGPVCAGGFLWWQVSYGSLTGYTVEGSRDDYFVEPFVEGQATATPSTSIEDCVFAPRLKIGGLAFVNSTTPLRMRDQPSTQGREIRQIQNDQNMNVLEGPVCAEGYVWWRVAYKEATGWTVEGSADGFFLDGIDPTATPIPTMTYTPTQTFTPSLTPTSTLTPTPTFTPTITPTPRPRLLTVYDVEWSADGETLYVVDENSLVNFDMARLDAPGVPVMNNDPYGFYRTIMPDPADENAIYLMGERTLDRMTFGENDKAQLYIGEQISTFSISADGARYAVVDRRGNDDQIVGLVYDSETDELVREIELPMRWSSSTMAISPDGAMIAVSQIETEQQANLSNTIGVQAVEEGDDIPFNGTYMSVDEPVMLSFAPDSSFLIAVSTRGDIERFAPDGTREASFIRADSAANYYMLDLAIHPQNKQVALVEYDNVRSVGVLRVYNADSLTEIFALNGKSPYASVDSLAYSPDGAYLAVVNSDRVLILETENFNTVAVLEWVLP